MSRGRRNGKQIQKKTSERPRCRWCQQRKSPIRLDKHVEFCRQKWLLQHRRVDRAEESEDDGPAEGMHTPMRVFSPMPIDSPRRPRTSAPDLAFIGPKLPTHFLKIVPRPRSVGTLTEIIPLDGPLPSSQLYADDVQRTPHNQSGSKPWFPHRTRANFEVCEIVVRGGLNAEMTRALLPSGKDDLWIRNGSRVTLRSYDELQAELESARRYGVRFHSSVVSAKYKGSTRKVQFEYRNLWDWIVDSVTDPTLSKTAMYNSVKKYYCEGGVSTTYEERFVDEPNSGDTWAKYEEELPRDPDPYTHCLLPLHFWLDEGLVTKRVKVHPMVARLCSQPGNIRNASGNGGGVLVGYMVEPEDESDPTSRTASEKLEFAQFKKEIYQKILRIVFSCLNERSWNGEPINCPDSIIRVMHPCILICSLDGKEAAYFNACRAALANCPCPKCLVHKQDLHRITEAFDIRTVESMQAALRKARQRTTKTHREKILQSYGIHDIKHFMWDMRFSDPYAAYSYDTLHSDDLGKWKDHLWSLLLEVLEEMKLKGDLTQNMKAFPRWANLKHFNQVSTVHFTDGQSFYDILKCILYCIVQILPANDPLVHCIRAYQRYRILVGMHCMPETRLLRLKAVIKDYRHWCSKVSERYGKDFDFFKQHAVAHVLKDIWDKGTTNHGSTRPGEGFQQEARAAYETTNRKDAEHQMVRHDETQEAVARIRMNIDNYDAAERAALDYDAEVDETPVDPSDDAHWSFGAPVPGGMRNSRIVPCLMQNYPAFADFDYRLRQFIQEEHPDEGILLEDTIMIRQFQCLYISYQSQEDWRPARDIIRCNASFHGRERFDCLLVNMTDPGLHFARVQALIRTKLPSGREFDAAIVRMFETSRWKPRTKWAGCQIRDESKDYTILSLDYVVRGALMAPVSLAANEPSHYLVDTVDADIFLRADAA
ncbi:hypothetical protein GGX14DRAFT_669953 [Mycena pura]|uniref:Transposase domain-containing protein n=1 Tax=Mycena pura TaxID=153505 RepID=A0AAD6YKN6_9AGAR|nr:hypothetical protein GGX14DRAFT_669953 [Mycena pura]